MITPIRKMTTGLQASLYNSRRNKAKQRIGSPPVALGNFNPPDYTQAPGYSYDASGIFTGGAVVTYTLIGTLPIGLTLNPTNGIISGTPTTVEIATGIRITGTNADGSSTTVKADIEIT